MVFSAIRNVYLAANDKRAEQLFVAFLGAKDFTRDAQAHPKMVLNKVNDETYLQHVIASSNLKDVEGALKDKGLHDSNKALLKAYRYLLEKITTEAASKGTRRRFPCTADRLPQKLHQAHHYPGNERGGCELVL